MSVLVLNIVNAVCSLSREMTRTFSFLLCPNSDFQILLAYHLCTGSTSLARAAHRTAQNIPVPCIAQLWWPEANPQLPTRVLSLSIASALKLSCGINKPWASCCVKCDEQILLWSNTSASLPVRKLQMKWSSSLVIIAIIVALVVGRVLVLLSSMALEYFFVPFRISKLSLNGLLCRVMLSSFCDRMDGFYRRWEIHLFFQSFLAVRYLLLPVVFVQRNYFVVEAG